MSIRGLLLPAALLLITSTALAASIISFEQFSDGQLLSTQVPGLTFTNTTVLTAGISLNELEFPPHSGANVASDSGGPISIAFASPVSSFSAFFTYSVPLTLQEFDSNNQPIAYSTSRFTSNLGISGNLGSSPNELLQILFLNPTSISKVVITGDPSGGSFVMDDIAFDPIAPEPSSYGLLLVGALVLLIAAAWRKVLA